MSVKTRWVSLLVVCGAGAWAQSDKPTVVVAPLELDPTPALQKVEPELRSAYFRAFDERCGALVPSMKETELALKDLQRRDFKESDEALSKLAQKASTLYAVFGALQYTLKKDLVVTGRVVRDDGKLMKTGRVESKKSTETLPVRVAALAEAFCAELGVKELATFKEVQPPVEVKPEPLVEVPPVKPDPEPSPLPVLVVDEGASQRNVGRGLFITGLAVGIAGGVTAGVGAANGAALGPAGRNVPADQYDAVVTAQRTTTVGLVVAGVGAVVTVVGAIVWGSAKPPPVAVSLSINEGRTGIVVGGTF